MAPAAENLPAAQLTHAPAPVLSVATAVERYLPAAHCVHVAAPVKDHRPVPHAVQVAVAPVVELAKPAAQDVHTLPAKPVRPVVADHEPAAHARQVERSPGVTEPYLPAGQTVQEEVVAEPRPSEYLPLLVPHVAQAMAFLTNEEVPAAQARCATAPVAVTMIPSQSTG